jgi:hypothetical protein
MQVSSYLPRFGCARNKIKKRILQKRQKSINHERKKVTYFLLSKDLISSIRVSRQKSINHERKKVTYFLLSKDLISSTRVSSDSLFIFVKVDVSSKKISR